MTSRLKKKARKKAGRSVGRMIHINTYAGTFRGRPRGKGGWIVLDSYEINPGVPPEQVMQTCACPDSGEWQLTVRFSGRQRTTYPLPKRRPPPLRCNRWLFRFLGWNHVNVSNQELPKRRNLVTRFLESSLFVKLW